MVYNAIKIGYRLLDGAGDYGNEKEAGEGVRRAIKDGLVKREDLCGFPLLVPWFRILLLIKYTDPYSYYLQSTCLRSDTLDPNL